MEQHQHHPQHKQLMAMVTTPTPPHPHPQHPPLNNSSSQDQQVVEVDDKKNDITLLHIPPTTLTHTPHTNNNNNVNLQLKPAIPLPGPGRDDRVRYRECLKNHGASMGANVVDGCCEFMPGGKEGTFDALKCAACQCHRNFHRRDHEFPTSAFYTISSSGYLPFHHYQPMSAAVGGGVTESSSDDLIQVFDEMPQREYDHLHHHIHNPPAAAGSNNSNRKRFRTKFTQEQKDKLLEFAEKLDWRLQRQDDEMVERFCNEVGVRRQVLKVWMHNNKNSLKKQLPLFIPPPQQHQSQSHPIMHLHQQETL